MEPLHGAVDHLLLTFWQVHALSAGDFQANKAGAVVVHPSLCRVLVEASRLPQRRVDDEARELRTQMLDAATQEAAPAAGTATSTLRHKRR
jgi:hypothetical protein